MNNPIDKIDGNELDYVAFALGLYAALRPDISISEFLVQDYTMAAYKTGKSAQHVAIDVARLIKFRTRNAVKKARKM